MTVNETAKVISRAIAGVAAIAAIISFGQIIALLIYGGSALEHAGRFVFLCLSPLMIWFIAPKIVMSLYKGDDDLLSNNFKVVMFLIVGVVFGLFVVTELLSLGVAWYTYSQRMIDYESSLVIKGTGIVLLATCAALLIKKGSNNHSP